MKWFKVLFELQNWLSPLTRGAWIEIKQTTKLPANVPSPLTRGAWIEMDTLIKINLVIVSPLTRGAWIEIMQGTV